MSSDTQRPRRAPPPRQYDVKINLHVSSAQIARLDQVIDHLVAQGRSLSRAEAIREAIETWIVATQTL